MKIISTMILIHLEWKKKHRMIKIKLALSKKSMNINKNLKLKKLFNQMILKMNKANRSFNL